LRKFLNSSCDTPTSPLKAGISAGNDHNASRPTAVTRHRTGSEAYEQMINGYFEDGANGQSPVRNSSGLSGGKHIRNKSANITAKNNGS